MKKLLVLAGILMSLSVYSQDYDKVSREVDKFTGEITIKTPMKGAGVMLYKFINRGKVSYYLSLGSWASTVNFGCKGVIVMFNDGTKWTKSAEKVSVNYYGGSEFVASSFISITPEELKLFTVKGIKRYRLYIYDSELEQEESDKLLSQINQVVSMK